MGETTTGGRRELVDRKGQLDYDALMSLTLQRARSAREAIQIVDQLANEHGYGSSGETFSIADKDEAWLMELIGKGPGRKGIVWVAARCPTAASPPTPTSRGSPRSRSTTRRTGCTRPTSSSSPSTRGTTRPSSGKPFSYRDAYHPNIGASQKRACAGRVWSIYRRSSPSSGFSDAWFRGAEGVEDYPLFVKPDRPSGVRDVMALMRDHFEGTPYDMTKGIDAGPFGSPGPVPRPGLHRRRQASCGSGRSRRSRPASSPCRRAARQPARCRRWPHLVHARRGLDLVLRPALLQRSTPCPSRSSWATTASSRSTRPGGSGTSSRT